MAPRKLRVRGYVEMCSTCNLVNVQTMHGIYIYIYIMIDIQMLIVTYMLFIVSYDIHCACAMLQCILQLYDRRLFRRRGNGDYCLAHGQVLFAFSERTLIFFGFCYGWFQVIKNGL